MRAALLRWYTKHTRPLPWRNEPDPYRILLSEVLLQQTRVEQARKYYANFLERFPTLDALAQADEEEVLAAWAGAGYYARARRLHALARKLPGGALPASYSELLQLPGLGPYTAAAVASIAFGEAVAAVDGNVRRVLCRLLGWADATQRKLREAAQALLEESSPGTWNQAMMELGALVCTTRRASCPSCPWGSWCKSFGNPTSVPRPRPRKARAVRGAALVLMGRGGQVMERRGGPSLGGLWGVPYEEGEQALHVLLARFSLEDAAFLGQVRHAFTHKRLTIDVYAARVDQAGMDPSTLAVSRLDEKILALARERAVEDVNAGQSGRGSTEAGSAD